MSLDRKRWLILAAGLLANLCQGAAYASSVFAKPMLLHLGLTVMKNGAPAPDMTKWATAFSINLACLPLGMLLSGKIADKRSSRLVVVMGGMLFGLGMFLAGFANSLCVFYISFGILMGLGSGAAYGAVVSTAVRWFPDMRGLASGLAVGALGFGSFVIAPVAVWLMGIPADESTAVLFAFKVLGIAFLAIMALASIIMVNPPADYKPAGFTPKAAVAQGGAGTDLVWTQMLARGRFWLLYAMYACGAFSGLMIISQMSPIAQSTTKQIVDLGDPKQMAVAAGAIVALLGLANAGGRIFWGFVSDFIGRMWALAAMFLVTAVMMFLLPKLAVDKSSLIPAVIAIGACYGGYLGIFPSLCADTFGVKNMAVNYGLLFSAFSVAALFGPVVGAGIFKSTGSYSNAFVIASAVALAGFVLTLIAKATEKTVKATKA